MPKALEGRARDRRGTAVDRTATDGCRIADHWLAAGDDRRALAATIEAALAAERRVGGPDAHRRYLRARPVGVAPDAVGALIARASSSAAETAVLMGSTRRP